jgi:hypothetical protein
MFKCDCGKTIASDTIEDHIHECVLMKERHAILFNTLDKAYNEARGDFKAESNLKAMLVCFSDKLDKLDKLKQPFSKKRKKFLVIASKTKI